MNEAKGDEPPCRCVVVRWDDERGEYVPATEFIRLWNEHLGNREGGWQAHALGPFPIKKGSEDAV